MHAGQRTLGLLASLVTLAMLAVGVGALVRNYALEEPSSSLLIPTAATLAATAAVVLALVALGVGPSRRLENPYW